MKKFHTVQLVFFEDDTTGDYGVAHKKTYNEGQGFNAFWNGIGIFHDVFEHWFENKHKYFRGDYAMNRGGECAAMGAALYYYNDLRVYNRVVNQYSRDTFEDSIRLENEDAIHESIKYGYSNYGSRLESKIPIQRPTDNEELEYQIKELWNNIKLLSPKSAENEDCGKEYKNSVTYRKLANLYRWGYRMAERLIPNNYHNQQKLQEFIDYFNNFCKLNSAQDLYNNFSRLDIPLYKNKKEVYWKATLISKYPSETKDYELPNIPTSVEIEDYIIY